jgi:hypothetical protein
VSTWRILSAVLLVGAAVGAVARGSDASAVGRVAGVLAALGLCAVAHGLWRGRRWASGAAFFLGLFWLWATLALRMQGLLGVPESAVWIAWAIVVMMASIRARTTA